MLVSFPSSPNDVIELREQKGTRMGGGLKKRKKESFVRSIRQKEIGERNVTCYSPFLIRPLSIPRQCLCDWMTSWNYYSFKGGWPLESPVVGCITFLSIHHDHQRNTNIPHGQSRSLTKILAKWTKSGYFIISSTSGHRRSPGNGTIPKQCSTHAFHFTVVVYQRDQLGFKEGYKETTAELMILKRTDKWVY